MALSLERWQDDSAHHGYVEVDQGAHRDLLEVTSSRDDNDFHHGYADVDQGAHRDFLEATSSQDENNSVVDASLRTHSRWQRSLKVVMLFMVATGVSAIGLHFTPRLGVQLRDAKEFSQLAPVADGPPPGVEDNDTNTCHMFQCNQWVGGGPSFLTIEHRPFLKQQSWLIKCLGGCTHELCCDSSCLDYPCPSTRPYLNARPYYLHCHGNCSDSFCCHTQPETCMDKQCHEDYEPRAMAWTIACPRHRCSHDRCCKKIMPTCANVTCAFGYMYKPGYNRIHCNVSASASCSTEYCCTSLENNCSSFTCPHHYMLNARSSEISCDSGQYYNDGICDVATCCHTPYPPWALEGSRVIKATGNITRGNITSMVPLSRIDWEDGSVLSPVADWHDIVQAPPPWVRKGMRVQSESLKMGNVSVLYPLWAIEWLDGSKTDSATKQNASWNGIVELPPSWAAVGVKVMDRRGRKGIIATMPRASIDWNDGGQTFPVECWAEISRGNGFGIAFPDKYADTRIAFSLVMAIVFIMMLFTLVNFEADDVRRYTWNIFAGVASVFMAYLLFSTVNRAVQAFANGFGDISLCSIQYCVFFAWSGLGLLVSAFVSGILGEGADHSLNEEVWVKADYLRSDYGYPIFNSMHVRHSEGVRSICIIQGVEVLVEKKKRNLEVRQRYLKCWGMLFSDVAGFAAISAGGSLQHLEAFSGNPISALVPVLISHCLISAIYTCFSSNGKPDLLSDLRKRMFVEEISASEVDISALTCSFLFVQVLRFKLTGTLPSSNGILDSDGIEPYIVLYCCGLALGILSLILISLKSSIVTPQEEALSGSARFLNIASATLGMGFAWCIVFATRALLRSYVISSESGIGMESIFGSCVLALSLSIACMLSIWVNNVVERICQRIMRYRPYSAEVVLRIITAESLFVGYTWVSAFSESVDAVCSLTPNPILSTVLLVALAFFVIMPAWQKYIVPKTMLLHAYHLKKLAGAACGRVAPQENGDDHHRDSHLQVRAQ